MKPLSASQATRLSRAYWAILFLASLCLSLILGVTYLLVQRSDSPVPLATALHEPVLRQQVIERLVAENSGLYDSHVDADVGRINMPGLQDRIFGPSKTRVSTNRFGLRERDYLLPKPPGLVRIVILGDSIVYGIGAAAEDRMGVHLEKWLGERVPEFAGRIECLHIGVPSWNIRAESSYLRRQLSDLQPDLVIHIILPNDLEDLSGTRGFGVQSSFSPQVRQRADSLINVGVPRRVLRRASTGYGRIGLDYESRSRYQLALVDLQRLVRLIGQRGGSYHLLVHFRKMAPVAWKHLGRHLNPAQVSYVSKRFAMDKQYWVSPSDPHWNRAGHIKIAQLIYGLIVRDKLLPQLALPVWEDAIRAVEDLAVAGRREAEYDLSVEETLALHGSRPITSRLNVAELDRYSAKQIHGGLDSDGFVSPYASFFLKNDTSRHVRIEGHSFDRPELDGTQVRVFVDAEQVGAFTLEANRKLELRYALPPALAEQPYVSVRFEANDYIYQGPDLQHCVVFQLQLIALEP